jgi:uncharacterized repeat protein (TIGR01451 family)
MYMRFRKQLLTVSFVVSSVLPLAGASVGAISINPKVSLDALPLVCRIPDGEFTSYTSEGCDLGLDKQVSVNGGAFSEADTSVDAVAATVGDTVSWKITITDQSASGTPQGSVVVHDVLPSGVSFSSYNASSGTYASNDWTVSLPGNLPATLTITSTAVATGEAMNVANLATYNYQCDGPCSGVYQDADPDNDSDTAWINVSAKPVVLSDNETVPPKVLALVDTGSNLGASIAALLIILSAAGIALAGRKYSAKR